MILDTKKHNCANCAYWAEGRCLAATHHDTYSDKPIFQGKAESSISVEDGSGYFAALHTPADHVCAEWGPKAD